MRIDSIKALVFDVFGSVVDWRSSVIDEGRALGREKGISIDWESFADRWREKYQPSLDRVRRGEREWTRLDDLHRESLVELLTEFCIEGLSNQEIDHFNRVWHRLRPWPDAVEGLQRLKVHFTLGTLSNGNISLLVNMAKNAGLPWDVILGAEPARTYKPLPGSYLLTCDFLGLPPAEVMLVAAHNDDLVQARHHGMGTAFVARPTEFGPSQSKDLRAEHRFDITAHDFLDLADQLTAASSLCSTS